MQLLVVIYNLKYCLIIINHRSSSTIFISYTQYSSHIFTSHFIPHTSQTDLPETEVTQFGPMPIQPPSSSHSTSQSSLTSSLEQSNTVCRTPLILVLISKFISHYSHSYSYSLFILISHKYNSYSLLIGSLLSSSTIVFSVKYRFTFVILGLTQTHLHSL